MKIGILGSGNIGGPLGRMWAAAGRDVMFSSRNPNSLGALAAQAGLSARIGTIDEAMRFGEVVLDALPFAASMTLPALLLEGKLLVTASNYYPQRDGDIKLGAPSQTQALAARLSGTRVVKAFNMMFAEEMDARADGSADVPIAVFLAGDDPAAKEIVAGLIRDAKFAPVDVGGLADGLLFQNGQPLYAKRWSEAEARIRVAEARPAR